LSTVYLVLIDIVIARL